MDNYWLFVITEYSDYNPGSVDYIIKKLSEEKEWKIGFRTLYRNKLRKKDNIIFYVSGNKKMYFIAYAKLGSKFIDINDPIYGIVLLEKITFFKKPIYIKPLINKLNFIKNKKYWGLSLQNGIASLSKKDYELICARDYQTK